MALVLCRLCEGSVSSRAQACPTCGWSPMHDQAEWDRVTAVVEASYFDADDVPPPPTPTRAPCKECGEPNVQGATCRTCGFRDPVDRKELAFARCEACHWISPEAHVRQLGVMTQAGASRYHSNRGVCTVLRFRRQSILPLIVARRTAKESADRRRQEDARLKEKETQAWNEARQRAETEALGLADSDWSLPRSQPLRRRSVAVILRSVGRLPLTRRAGLQRPPQFEVGEVFFPWGSSGLVVALTRPNGFGLFKVRRLLGGTEFLDVNSISDMVGPLDGRFRERFYAGLRRYLAKTGDGVWLVELERGLLRPAQPGQEATVFWRDGRIEECRLPR